MDTPINKAKNPIRIRFVVRSSFLETCAINMNPGVCLQENFEDNFPDLGVLAVHYIRDL